MQHLKDLLEVADSIINSAYTVVSRRQTGK